MNYSTAIFLVNKDARAVAVSYERDANGAGVKPFMPHKTFDHTLQVGDLVVVPTDTRHHMTVCRIEEVDIEVDLESPAQVSWLVGRVDPSEYEEVLRREQAAIQAIKSAEHRAKREELARKLLADTPGLAALSAIAPAAIAGPVAQ